MVPATSKAPDARGELKAFLRARRAELPPETVGFPRGSRRLTPGLRREEVAQLAGVGLTWYTWLEQGRNIRVSAEVLDRIATALRLSNSDKAYLFALAGHPLSSNDYCKSEIDEAIKLALASIEMSPAIIVNPRFDIVSSNALAHSMFELDSYEGPFVDNLIWRAFMDPAVQTVSPTRTDRRRSAVGILRSNYASRIGDPHFELLLRALREASDDFARTWDHCSTESLAPARFHLNSPRLGNLSICAACFTIPEHPGFLMIIYAPADEGTAAAFRREASRLRTGSTGDGAGRKKHSSASEE
jgi:transcriptional regulator with XRE-family HTH domain